MTQDQTKDQKAPVQYGVLANENGKTLELQVLQSYAGFYLGTFTEDGPFTRESQEYWKTEAMAKEALDAGRWTQKQYL